MRNEKVGELSPEKFQPFGSFAPMINPAGAKLGAPPIEFYRDMLSLKVGTPTASFSVCRVEKRPMVVDVTEFHSWCGEGILPLDGDILIHVGPATPKGEVPVEKIKIFRVPRGTMVTLNPGVWHHAPFAYKSVAVNVLIVLPERTYANDCIVEKISPIKQIKVKT
jgi:ureidoglycolate lyase